jgi:chromosome segregation ATPase
LGGTSVERSAVSFLLVGLVIGVVAGYGVGFVNYQSQISGLQSDLSETQTTLSASQSEVESLQSQLATTEANLTRAQTTIASLQAQLSESEAEYATLSSEYDEFKSDVTSIVNSLNKKMNLEKQIIKMWVHYERGEVPEMTTVLLGLQPYVDAVGDTVLNTLWDEFLTHFNAGEYTEADAKLADLMERNSALIQSDLSELTTLLES